MTVLRTRNLYTGGHKLPLLRSEQDFSLESGGRANPAPGRWGNAAGYYTAIVINGLGNHAATRKWRPSDISPPRSPTYSTDRTNPISTNALATQRKNSLGQIAAGFGYINVGTVFSSPTQGLVAPFQFDA